MSTGTMTTKVKITVTKDVREELALEPASRADFPENRDGFFGLHREKSPMRDLAVHCRSSVRRRPWTRGTPSLQPPQQSRCSDQPRHQLIVRCLIKDDPDRGPCGHRIFEKACARMTPATQPPRRRPTPTGSCPVPIDSDEPRSFIRWRRSPSPTIRANSFGSSPSVPIGAP